MRKVTRYLLWAYVLTVPWDNFALPLVGTLSRASGLAVVGAAALMIAAEGRVRKPDAVLGFAIAFGVWSVMSLLWTLSYANTVETVTTYAQCAASVWVIRELIRTREEVEPVLAALLFGFFVLLTDLLNNFRLGVGQGEEADAQRYTGMGLNADNVGFFLVLGLPIAWHLVMHRRDIVRAAGLIYVVTAPVGLLLTATRGALVAGFVASAIVPLTLFRKSSWRSYAITGVLIVVGTLSALYVVPTYNWDRMGSTVGEATGGDMTGRTRVWSAGLQAFPQRPLLGAGAGAYGAAIDPYFRNRGDVNPHNGAIGLLVEQGIVGLVLFAGILGAAGWTIFRSPPPYGALWGVLLLTWLVGGMTITLNGLKITWVLFGLVSAQSGLIATGLDATAALRGSSAVGAMPHGRNAAGLASRAARMI